MQPVQRHDPTRFTPLKTVAESWSTMIRLDIRSDLRAVQQQLDRLQSGLRDRVISAAINKTADKARAEMNRQITSEFAIKASDVRSQTRVQRASAKNLQVFATLQAFGKRRGKRSRNVALFRARQTKKGVTVQIKKSGGRKIIEHAWIGNQGRTVFMRDGKQRLPIKPVETIDVPQMFNTKRINAAVIAKINKDFPVELARAFKALERRGQ